MSGHSKWSTIKRKKEATDKRRSANFARLLRAVEVAAREGGGSVDGNMTLASAVQKARESSVPSDNIERAIKKGTGELEGVTYDEVTYEGYGPGGVAILVQALTENRNRTVADIRSAFQKFGGNLGASGSVAWMFQKCGLVTVERAHVDEDRMMEIALEAGADDLSDSESHWEITTDPSSFHEVRSALESSGMEIASAEVTMAPTVTVPVDGSHARSVLSLVEALEDNEDVQSVAANFDIPEEVLAEAG